MIRRALLPALLGLSLVLSGCGFKLRGAPEYQNLAALTVTGGSYDLRNGTLDALEASGVAVHDAAPQTLRIDNERFGRRTVAVDAQGRAAEIELRYSFFWQLADSKTSTAITPRRQITLVRNFNYDPENATASSDEESYTRQDMYRDATWQLLRQLDAATRDMFIDNATDDGAPPPVPEGAQPDAGAL